MEDITPVQYPQDIIYDAFETLLHTLKEEKAKESNKGYAREIAVTLTETEKAWAYFIQYVYPNYFKEGSE